MKTITRISLVILGAVMFTVLISSCASGNAASRHSSKFSGTSHM